MASTALPGTGPPQRFGSMGAWWPASWRERVLFVTQVAALGALIAAIGTRTWQDREWVGYLLLAGATLAWLPELPRKRMHRVWFFYVAGIFLYTLLRARADETVIPVRSTYVIDLDSLLFLGKDPVVALQREFFHPRDIDWFDWLAVGTHWSFFVAPHALALGIFLSRRELFPRYAALVVFLMYASLLLFFVLPTSPPWLAATQGDLPYVFRVMDWTANSVNEDTYEAFYASLGEPNSVAAMPSLHVGLTFAMFLWAFSHARRLAWVLLAYSLAMAFALVYLAEHYVVDLLAGAGLAVLCWFLVCRLVPGAATTLAFDRVRGRAVPAPAEAPTPQP
ncbi:MAG: phosphatase PAP2 family protein [Dehalococcoidia bacterium]